MSAQHQPKYVALRYDDWKVSIVKSGVCRQTIRKNGKANVGDFLLHMDATPYSHFRNDVCVRTRDILFVSPSRWMVDGEYISLNTRHAIARADGFRNAFELEAYIASKYKLPFHGTVIQW